MRVLVTGGAGFIASHIADALLARGDSVVVLDDLSNGVRGNVPGEAAFVEGDVRDPSAVDRAFNALGAPCEAVCHLAGQASTFRSFDEPAWDMDVNGVGTARLLEGAWRHRAHTFLYASSMTAYGEPDTLPVSEDAPCEPVSFYGITKWAAERAVIISARQPGATLRAAAFRMFNVYGPRQSLTNPYQGVLGIFLGNVLRGEPIRIFGSGEQSRDFVYVGDVARAWAAALHGLPPEPVAINLGTGTSTSINQLWRHAVRATGHDPDTWPVSWEEGRPGDQMHMRADISLAERALGWRPMVALEDGMARTAAWAREDTLGS